MDKEQRKYFKETVKDYITNYQNYLAEFKKGNDANEDDFIKRELIKFNEVIEGFEEIDREGIQGINPNCIPEFVLSLCVEKDYKNISYSTLRKIEFLESLSSAENDFKIQLNLTPTETVELSKGLFENGNVEKGNLGDVINFFAQLSNVEVKHHSQTFIEIRTRKRKIKTIFLDQLNNTLKAVIDKFDAHKKPDQLTMNK